MGRRGWGDDGVYFDHRADCHDAANHKGCNGRWRGVVSLGFGPDGKRVRRKVSGQTKTEVKDKLRALHTELDAGVRTQRGYTVQKAVDDWLASGLPGRAAKTVEVNQDSLRPVLGCIGTIPLADLTAHDVRTALNSMATTHATRTIQKAHNCLTRAIRQAEGQDLVRRNVSSLVDTPCGRQGRPSQSLTLDQARALLAAARQSRLYAYIVLCLLTGIRSEEARALIWEHVVTWVDDVIGWQPVSVVGFDGARAGDDRFAIYVWRSERHGGDTKTEKSRRTLALPRLCVDALREHWYRQAKERAEADALWHEHGLVLCTSVGTPFDSHNLRRDFRKVTKAAGIGERWVPKELRTSFVSLMSHSGVPVEEIARLAGHSSSHTTETIYRRELRPVITTGAEVMDQIFR
jgi:integrase